MRNYCVKKGNGVCECMAKTVRRQRKCAFFKIDNTSGTCTYRTSFTGTVNCISMEASSASAKVAKNSFS